MEVFTAEFTFELQPIDANSAYVQSAEFTHEAKSLALTAVQNVGVESQEFDREIAGSSSPLVVQAQSAEFEFELVSVGLPASITLQVHGAEFAWELQPVDIIPITVNAAEFDREFKAVSVGFLQPTTAEFDRESGSLPVVLNVNAQASEYGREIEGVGGASQSSLAVDSAEFGLEAKSLALAKNIVITGPEFTWELRPVDITTLSPASSEYGREIAGSSTAANVASPQSAEFERSVSSVFLSESSNPTVVVQSAEFGYEFQPITNITPVGAEFENEISSVGIQEFSGSVVAPEFDWEARSVSISVASNVQGDASEFDHEIQSAQISTVLEPGDVEFEREFGSAQISAVLVGQSAEFDYEAESVSLTQTGVSNEYDYESGSPQVLQSNAFAPDAVEFDHEIGSARLPVNSGTEAGSVERHWEAGEVVVRTFRRRVNTPRDRVKVCRQI